MSAATWEGVAPIVVRFQTDRDLFLSRVISDFAQGLGHLFYGVFAAEPRADLTAKYAQFIAANLGG
jgi:hypothetical protein